MSDLNQLIKDLKNMHTNDPAMQSALLKVLEEINRHIQKYYTSSWVIESKSTQK